MGRFFRPRRLLLFYFGVFFLVVVWLLYNIESFCPQDDSSYTREKAKELSEKADELVAIGKKLSIVEKQLRKEFPDRIDRLLHHADSLSPVYAITPTYARLVQKAELTRLIHTFLHVPNFHWIVVEDAASKTNLVTQLLHNSGLKYTHLNEPTPSEYKMQPSDPNWLKPRGVLQRNKGIAWLHENSNLHKGHGVVYFADDDNTYGLELFEEMRNTIKVSVWPVGLVGYLRFERPIVKNNKVKGWFTYWKPDRVFATDMAGFAINLQLFMDHPKARFSNMVKRGELESDLIGQLGVTLDDLEPKASDCTKVYVWHTRAEKPSLKNEDKLQAVGRLGSDPNVEV